MGSIEKNITKEQYLEALSIIEKYHLQLKNNIANLESKINKTPIKEWFFHLPYSPSRRLSNLLLRYGYVENGTPFEYIEDITQHEFFRLRNAGKSTWEELVSLRGY